MAYLTLFKGCHFKRSSGSGCADGWCVMKVAVVQGKFFWVVCVWFFPHLLSFEHHDLVAGVLVHGKGVETR